MANLLTVFRIMLSFLAMGLLFTGNATWCVTALFMTIFIIALDGLDGYIARMNNETSTFGSVFDIVGDRIVENLYWITFAILGWVSVWIPMVVLARGILTDSFRGMALTEGYTAFGDKTMMQNPIGKFLTSSRFSRALYGVAKTLAFLMVILANIPEIEYFDAMTVNQYSTYMYYKPLLLNIADICVYVTVAMCIIRGIPVFIESKRFFNNDKK